MSEQSAHQIPRSFYIVAGLALLWNLIGMAAYVSQVTMDAADIAALPAEQQPLYENIPVWVTAAYATAVTAGVIASIALLLRQSWALQVFVLSLVGVIVQMSHSLLLTDAISIMGPTVVVGPVAIIAIGIALIWYCAKARSSGWIPRSNPTATDPEV